MTVSVVLFFGASGIRVEGFERIWIEIKPADVEIDRVLESLTIPEAACGSFDPLDFRVERLGSGVGRLGDHSIHDAVPMRLDHPRDLFHRFEPTAYCPVVPMRPGFLCPCSISIVP